MKVLGVLPFARLLLENALSEGDIAVDCTVGNGHDTLFLANVVGENGHVYGFDVQEQAIEKATEKLTTHEVHERVTLFQTGHEEVRSLIPKDVHSKLKGAIFNLGYLPGGDKTIVTRPTSTMAAISALLEMMPLGGTIVLVIYHGHEEGKVEKETILSFLEQYDQRLAHILKYEFINQANNPPFVVAIEKR
ncbi:methyltransferase domain-containing protein [Alkalihalobacillus sp. MEB130]|uniref:class I SAM-dependent methyltransferase n=1 Tax=Alkalihalobacillus sp. MEB130 TaxID=2976704 RepID=UPI0028DDF4BD|nr:class I SAM-dependent methyltransferase [Alkalihalobacillus sp. MEB130]MDT8859323.1 methyltransferase domain-containing protein [Alkalihalobacillus sp. MEB130]